MESLENLKSFFNPNLTLEPRVHQKEAVAFFSTKTDLKTLFSDENDKKTEDRFMFLFHSPGLGKTVTCILCYVQITHYYFEKYNQNKGNRLIISCPVGVIDHWYNEVKTWLNLKEKYILRSNSVKEFNNIDINKLKKFQIIIVSHGLVLHSFKCGWEKQQNSFRANGRWTSSWIRKPKIPNIFQLEYNMLVIDELHMFRNENSTACLAHNQLSQCSKCRIGCTATPICNGIADGVGICKAVNSTPKSLQSIKNWCVGDDLSKLNRKAAEDFRLNMHYCPESTIQLPKMTSTVVNFHPKISPKLQTRYNLILKRAHALFKELNSTQLANNITLKKRAEILACFNKMQKIIICPTLSKYNLFDAMKNKDLMEKFLVKSSNFFKCLINLIKDLEKSNHTHIVIVAMHTSYLHLSLKLLQKQQFTFQFYGTLTGVDSIEQRQSVQNNFLCANSGILGLSCRAGGNGLNLVSPTCQPTCMIFLQQSYNPQDIQQAQKRIHRMNCTKPVDIFHIVATSSIDCAIRKMHDDKKLLFSAILKDEDWKEDDETLKWKQKGRLVELANAMNENGVLDETLKEGLSHPCDEDSEEENSSSNEDKLDDEELKLIAKGSALAKALKTKAPSKSTTSNKYGKIHSRVRFDQIGKDSSDDNDDEQELIKIREQLANHELKRKSKKINSTKEPETRKRRKTDHSDSSEDEYLDDLIDDEEIEEEESGEEEAEAEESEAESESA